MTVALPIDKHLPEIAAALDRRSSVIVKADTGVGKTTRLPPYLMERMTGQVLVLEPRRLAARLTAERVAEERGEAIGQRVGYRVRHDAKVSSETRLTFVTEGVFLRLIAADPQLSGVECVILDEFHERNIQTDLAIALVAQLQKSRPGLKMVVMSATIDTSALEKYLEGSEVQVITTTHYPVETVFIPPQEKEYRERHVCRAIDALIQDRRTKGHVLVFLTGLDDILRVSAALKSRLDPRRFEVTPLAASLPHRLQQQVFTPSEKRKIVCATNVAETSLTIPGIDAVVDLGLAKIAGHAPWSGVETLETKRVSKASCVQRSGRAGRTGPGVVYRLYSEGDYLGRPDFTPPDIQRLDLSAPILELQNIQDKRTDEISSFPWFEPPSADSLGAAEGLLRRLGAIDAKNKITSFGRELAAVPLHPRLATIALVGKNRGIAEDALLAACVLNEGLILNRNVSAFEKAPCDLCFQMDIVKAITYKQDLPYDGLEKAVSQKTVQRVVQLYENLARFFGAAKKIPKQRTKHQELMPCLLAGFPDRVAKLRQQKKEKKHVHGKRMAQYTFCLGRGGLLNSSSVLQQEELILILDATERLKDAKGATATMIWAASRVTAEALEQDPAGFITKDCESEFDRRRDIAEAFEVLSYGQVVIARRPLPADPESVSRHLSELILKNWPHPFSEKELDRYQRRLSLLATINMAEGFLDLDDLPLRELFVESLCDGQRSLSALTDRSLTSHILAQLSYEQQQILDTYTPLRLKLRNGRELKVTYSADGGGTLTGFIQDFFGVTKTPTIVDGQVTLRLSMLGPNKRPAQTTGDLAGFWKNGYVRLRQELSRRYPKHYWPEDPATAKPFLHKSAAFRAKT